MTFVSLFAGVGGFDLGFERAGHTCVGQCEIDPHARSVLARHWPDVPKHDDVSTIRHDTFEHPDIVTFGSPCQDLSVAGRRAGMEDGTRSGLFYEAVRYIREIEEASGGRHPRFAIWENVPGAYSSNDGRDFAAVLALLVGGDVRRPARGWPNAGAAFGPGGSAEWRTLDSRYFGVAQRRRRVFLIYRPRADSAGAVLLEPDGVRGDPEAIEGSRSRAAPGAFRGTAASGDVVTALTGGLGAGGACDAHAQAGWLVPLAAQSLTTGTGRRYGPDTETLAPITAAQEQYLAAPIAFALRGRDDGAVPEIHENGVAHPVAFAATDYKTGRYDEVDTAPAITTTADRTRGAPIAFAQNQRDEVRELDVAGALASQPGMKQQTYVATSYAVRRFTPRECERLQAFPDDWTRYRAAGPRPPEIDVADDGDEPMMVPHPRAGDEIADSHRYRMMGNAVTVSVVEWIGRRLS